MERRREGGRNTMREEGKENVKGKRNEKGIYIDIFTAVHQSRSRFSRWISKHN